MLARELALNGNCRPSHCIQPRGPCFGQAHAADFGMAVGCSRDVIGIDRFTWLAGDLRYSDQGFHRADVSQLGSSQHNIADGVNSRFGSLHP